VLCCENLKRNKKKECKYPKDDGHGKALNSIPFSPFLQVLKRKWEKEGKGYQGKQKEERLIHSYPKKKSKTTVTNYFKNKKANRKLLTVNKKYNYNFYLKTNKIIV
jgi:hypothetical protein